MTIPIPQALRMMFGFFKNHEEHQYSELSIGAGNIIIPMFHNYLFEIKDIMPDEKERSHCLFAVRTDESITRPETYSNKLKQRDL